MAVVVVGVKFVSRVILGRNLDNYRRERASAMELSRLGMWQIIYICEHVFSSYE